MRMNSLVLGFALALALVGCSGTAGGGTGQKSALSYPTEASRDSGTQDASPEGKGTAPISARLSRMKSCIEQQGLEVEYGGRGDLESPALTTEQNTLWAEIAQECSEEAGMNAPWTEAELRELYQLEVKNHECLLAAGYDSGEPTSEQAYIDAWHQGTEPYQSISLVADQDPGKLFFAATQVCPPPLWSFGD